MRLGGSTYPRLALTQGGEGRLDPQTQCTEAGAWTSADERAVDIARAAGSPMVELTGHHVGRHPDLGAIWQELRTAGMKAALVGPASDVDLDALDLAVAEVVVLPLLGPAAVHDAALGAGDHAAVMALLARDKPRVRLVVPLSAHAAEAVRAGRSADRITLVGATAEPAWVEACWEAARGGAAPLEYAGPHLPPDGHLGPRRPLDDNLLRLRAGGAWLPGLGAGTTGTPPVETARLAHALGLPVDGVALPDARRPLAGPVAVVVPHLGDLLLALATLPGLVHALRDRGVEVTLQSVWAPPWNLHAPPAHGRADARLDQLAAADLDDRWLHAAATLEQRFLQRVDLSAAHHVIVPGWSAARTLLTNPTLRADVTIDLVDLHLLDGVDAWRPTPSGDAWLDPRVRVTSCFPAYAAGYHRRGVPLARVDWRPYPIWRPCLPTLPVGDALVAAGSQRRAHGALVHAARTLPSSPPIDVVSAQPIEAVGPLRARGVLPLSAFVAAIAAARAVVLPVEPHAHHAAGITAASLARALGRPVAGTRAWGLVDHLVDGRDGRLVAPEELATAIGEVSEPGWTPDAHGVSVAAWADDLVAGRSAAWPDRPIAHGHDPDA